MQRGAKSRMRRTETPEPIGIKFCMVVDIADVVTYTNFGDYRLRGFWVAGGQISPSPIDFHRRPYNTLALPCEPVNHVTLNYSTKCTLLEIIQQQRNLRPPYSQHRDVNRPCRIIRTYRVAQGKLERI